MTVCTNGYVDNPMTPEKLRKFAEYIENLAATVEARNLTHTSGGLSVTQINDIENIPFEGVIQGRPVFKEVRIDCDIVFSGTGIKS